MHLYLRRMSMKMDVRTQWNTTTTISVVGVYYMTQCHCYSFATRELRTYHFCVITSFATQCAAVGSSVELTCSVGEREPEPHMTDRNLIAKDFL